MSESPNYFSIIPANVRYDKRLKPNEKLLYSEITALCDKNGYCWATNSYFANLYDTHKNTVGVWIKHLKELGYIDIKIIYKKETKEIDKRIISIIVNTKDFNTTGTSDPINENIDRYQQKDCDPINEKIDTPINKKIEENNTRIDQYKINKKEINKEKENFIDYDFVTERYQLGNFSFDLDKFWLWYKDKAITKERLDNLLISWDIRNNKNNRDIVFRNQPPPDNTIKPEEPKTPEQTLQEIQNLINSKDNEIDKTIAETMINTYGKKDFDCWLADLKFKTVEGNKAIFTCSNGFMASQINMKFAHALCKGEEVLREGLDSVIRRFYPEVKWVEVISK